MASYTNGTMELVLPTKNVDAFMRFANPPTEYHRCLYRTDFEFEDQYDNPHGLSKLVLTVTCAWSALGCLIDPPEDRENIVSLNDVCKELEVRRLSAEFYEEGMCICEIIEYTDDEGMSSQCFEAPHCNGVALGDSEIYEDEEQEACDDATIGEIPFDVILNGTSETAQ